MSKASPASTTTSSSTNSYSPAPSSISSLTSSRLHFPSIPSGSILSNTPSVADTGVDQLPDAPSLLASRHAKGKMASRPGVTTPPPREEDPVMRHRIPDIFLRGSSKDRTAIHPRPQPRLKPSDLPPSRRVTSEDKSGMASNRDYVMVEFGEGWTEHVTVSKRVCVGILTEHVARSTMHVSPQTTNAEPQWSRASSAFLQEYPWDDVILLHDEASAIRDAFQADVPSITRQEVVKKDWQFERVEDSERQQAAGEHYLQPLIRALLRFERTEVHSPYGQTHAGTIRRFILQTKVELQGLTLPEGPPSSALLHAPDGIALSIPKMDMLSRYVALMRVIDVGSTLEGRRRHRTIPKWGGNWQPANNPALAFIHDMKALLMKAKNALQNVLSPFDDSAGSQTTTTAEGLRPPPFRIMRVLARSMGTTSGCYIVNNILLASLHLSWLLGHVDIPETFSNGTLELQGLTEIEKMSPLVLLRTVSVRKQSMKRVHLITAAIYNGNVKPPIIAMMEKMVFAVVFGIARGTTSIKDGIDSLLNDLPWDCVATLPPEVVSWFVLAPPLGVSSAANSPLHPRSSRDAAAFEPSSLPPISLEASRIASQGSSSNTSLATTSNFQPSLTPAHPSVDIHGLGILQGFAEFVQSAATSTNITSAFSQEVLAVVALGALGIVLDEAAVQQLVQQRHQPRTISGSAVVTFPSVSPGEVEFVPAADEPVHNSVSELILGNQPAVLPPPIEPTSPTLSQVFRDFDNLEPLQPFAESPHPDEELDSQPEANGIDKEQDSWSETDIIDEELDIRSEANSIEEEMDIRSEANSSDC
ncbi:hypothetical protein BKA70DRAFT_1241080 [Coprinopsis sp. MPI-PUGE-AT-0042]|nr:hypothetical protein BKA70DRAFT_1241080 [Coprinopsis sp. MPI-PUGE-AT-0042]